MKLNVQDWKEFKIPKLFDIYAGNYYNCDDYEPGITPYVSASATNNGVGQMINRTPDFKGNKIVTGKVECKAFYQGEAFCATSDANVYSPKFKMTQNVGLFLTSIITFNENGKWSYGRQCRVGDTKGITIKLPIKYNQDKTPFIDDDRTYSDEGYVPDWQFMEDYIKSLHHKPITTKVKSGSIKELDIDNWEEFTVNKLFDIYTGGDLIMSELEVGSIPVASNSCENNNIAFYSSNINGRKLFNHQTSISIADRGCFYAFVQPKDFYIATRVKALVVKDKINIAIKQLCFMATIINQESFKFSYGRNCCANLPYIKIKLPIQRDNKGNPIIDNNNTYSDKGYIPDWQFMEDYINFLPYSDKI